CRPAGTRAPGDCVSRLVGALAPARRAVARTVRHALEQIRPAAPAKAHRVPAHGRRPGTQSHAAGAKRSGGRKRNRNHHSRADARGGDGGIMGGKPRDSAAGDGIWTAGARGGRNCARGRGQLGGRDSRDRRGTRQLDYSYTHPSPRRNSAAPPSTKTRYASVNSKMRKPAILKSLFKICCSRLCVTMNQCEMLTVISTYPR